MLFLRFSWPCAQERLDKGLIKQCDFDELRSAVEKNTDIDPILLTLCYPNPVRKLRNFAIARHENMWAFETVYKFLLLCHEGVKDCAVMLGVIASKITSADSILVTTDWKSEYYMNTYHLQLEFGDKVLVHRRVIITSGK